MKINNINALRSAMGTLPSQEPELITEFRKGVENISVELVDHSKNPYKAMYVLATSCWGSRINKWNYTQPEHRFLVVKAVLEGKALPLALEAASFTFAIEGPSRAAFDQFARTRDGVVFSAKGMRDNNWKDAAIRIPNALWPEDKCTLNKRQIFAELLKTLTEVKGLYADIVDIGKGSWQAARAVLPLYVVYGYSASYNYKTLKNTCANRMKFCEMEDTVATAWLMANEINKAFPLLGSYLRPGCDYAGKCQYHQTYELSEAFGCLFKECGRNKCEATDEYAEFNETCTNYDDLQQQLRIHITKPDEWKKYEKFEDLSYPDQLYFMED